MINVKLVFFIVDSLQNLAYPNKRKLIECPLSITITETMLIKLKHESYIKFECRLRSPAQF